MTLDGQVIITVVNGASVVACGPDLPCMHTDLAIDTDTRLHFIRHGARGKIGLNSLSRIAPKQCSLKGRDGAIAP
jgi:hypothetical protein